MRVLLATDGLSAAQAAEQLLTGVARRDLEIFVVTAAGNDASGEDGVREVVRSTVGRLEKAGFRPLGRALDGEADEALPRFMDEEGIDLAVLGAGNRSWLGRVLFGSISTQLLHSHSSVLIVNEPPPAREGKVPVLVALDGSLEAGAAVRGVTDLLDPGRCSVRAFSVVAVRVPGVTTTPVTGYAAPGFDERLEAELMEEPRRVLESRAQMLEDEGFEVEKRVTLGAPVKRVLEEARDIEAALVVVGARSRGALERALVGSVSDQVARYTRAALIVRPESQEDVSSR